MPIESYNNKKKKYERDNKDYLPFNEVIIINIIQNKAIATIDTSLKDYLMSSFWIIIIVLRDNKFKHKIYSKCWQKNTSKN